jgi:sugar lactone lactonase YvrE
MNRTLRSAFGLLLVAALFVLPARVEAHPPHVGSLETIVDFNASLLEMPESIAIDQEGNLFVSLSFSGELRKIAPDGSQSTVAVFPIGPPLSFCGVFFNALGPITLDSDGNLYASVLACDPADRGVWKVSPDGDMELLANIPLTGLPNGIERYRDHLYVADTILGIIWRVPVAGGAAEVWLDHPLLKPAGPGQPGANGLQIHARHVFVANSSQRTIVAIPVRHNGTAGVPHVYVTAPASGCDDFALDLLGRVYCPTAPGNTLLRLSPNGTSEVLFTEDDGLDIPTAAAFGRAGADRFNLYITNGAYSVLGPSNNTPSIMRLRVLIPGAPFW